jgi:hypothetical protein
MCTSGSSCKRRIASPTGSTVLALSDAGQLTLTRGGKTTWTVGPFGSAAGPYALSLRPSGNLVLLANGQSAAVWSSGSSCKGNGGYRLQVRGCNSQISGVFS